MKLTKDQKIERLEYVIDVLCIYYAKSTTYEFVGVLQRVNHFYICHIYADKYFSQIQYDIPEIAMLSDYDFLSGGWLTDDSLGVITSRQHKILLLLLLIEMIQDAH